VYYQGCTFYQNKPSVAPFNGDLSLIEATDSGIGLKALSVDIMITS
jgi:hypothetical protein